MMITSFSSRSDAWQGVLAAATIAGTLATACMMPFVALAVASAATMPRGRAAATVGTVWATNQLLGFGLLGFPHDASTIAWGAALGVASLVAMAVAAAVLDRGGVSIARLVAAFGAAFAAYEGGLFLFALVAGGTGTFTGAIVARILLNDAGWCVVLLILHEALTRAAPRAFGLPLGLRTA